jgi:RNA polymerase-binding transcription factor DksA
MDKFPKNILRDVDIHLRDTRAHLAARISQLSAQDPFSDPDRVNDNAASDHEASEESSHDRFSAMVEELKSKLAATDQALSRIIEGTYGFCTNCGRMIDTDRLAVLPMATLCLDCERKKSAQGGSALGGK